MGACVSRFPGIAVTEADRIFSIRSMRRSLGPTGSRIDSARAIRSGRVFLVRPGMDEAGWAAEVLTLVCLSRGGLLEAFFFLGVGALVFPDFSVDFFFKGPSRCDRPTFVQSYGIMVEQPD